MAVKGLTSEPSGIGLAGSSQRDDRRVPVRASKRRYEMSPLENSRSRTRTADWLKRDFAGAEESWTADEVMSGRPGSPDVIASPAMTRPAAILSGTIRR